MATQKKLIDITLLGKYDTLIKQLIEKNRKDNADAIAANRALIGTVPEKVGTTETTNVVDYVNAKITEVGGDTSALAERVTANENAIGKKAGEGTEATGLYKYTDDGAAAAVSKVLDGAPEAFDTLKEIAAWIGNGDITSTTAAQMLADITTMKGDEDTEGSIKKALKDAKDYADEIVSAKNVDAEGETGTNALISASASYNKVKVASTTKLQNAVTRAEGAVLSVSKGTSSETYVTMSVTDGDDAKIALNDAALSTKIGSAKTTTAEAKGMYAEIQGQTNATVADVEEKVDALVLAEESDINALFAA